MAEKPTAPQVLCDAGANYEIALEEATSLLDQCWRAAETIAISGADGTPLKCSTMAERAVQKIARKLDIKLANRQIAIEAPAASYVVGLAKFGIVAWKDPKCSLSVDEKIVESARNETMEDLRREYENRMGEVEISCTDGVVFIHEVVADQLKVACNGGRTARLPISQRQLSVITDIVYFGKASFKRSELGAVFVASTFTNFGKIAQLSEELSREIANDWKSVLATESIGKLNSACVTVLCTREDFAARDDTAEIAASLEKWAEGSAARQTVKAKLLDLLQRNSAPVGTKDYTKFIYYKGHKFDGELWTVSELHEESSKRFSYTNAVVNAEGDRIVSMRPGPVGILSAKGGFIQSYNLPHDALGYGYPFVFQQFPYACLVFNTFDSRSKRFGTELWPWKGNVTFEPIHTSFQWAHVGDMVQVREDLYYVTGKRARSTMTEGTLPEGEDEDHEEKDEAGLFRMHVKRLDGVLHAEVELVEPYTSEQYCNGYNTEFFCMGDTLYRQQRDFDFKECIPSPTVLSRLEQDKFIPADDFQPVTGGMLQTWVLGNRTFAVASFYDETNSSCPCGFFELTGPNEWRDRTLETGFFKVCPEWKPVNDSAWRNFDLESI